VGDFTFTLTVNVRTNPTMRYDTWNPYDPDDTIPPEDQARLRQRLEGGRQVIRQMLPTLEAEIENPERDLSSVGEALKPYHMLGREIPMTPGDLPELERLCRLILERGGSRKGDIQEALLRLIGATAAAESTPFLIEMLRYSHRGDSFGPERRQLALWGLARIAMFHNLPEAYQALYESLADRNADVRFTVADLILNAYLSAGRDVPSQVTGKLRQMARSDPDDTVRYAAQRYLREPWAR
jgi:hypothetical protein